RRRHTRLQGDWSSDVCSSDLVISSFMERLYGRGAALVATALIMWTAFASVFSLLLGYSRVPYAAAQDRNYFRIFSRVHPRHQFQIGRASCRERVQISEVRDA